MGAPDPIVIRSPYISAYNHTRDLWYVIDKADNAVVYETTTYEKCQDVCFLMNTAAASHRSPPENPRKRRR